MWLRLFPSKTKYQYFHIINVCLISNMQRLFVHFSFMIYVIDTVTSPDPVSSTNGMRNEWIIKNVEGSDDDAIWGTTLALAYKVWYKP